MCHAETNLCLQNASMETWNVFNKLSSGLLCTQFLNEELLNKHRNTSTAHISILWNFNH